MTLKPSTGGLAALLLACTAPAALTQGTYPERPITVIVPFSAGGPSDTVARVVAQAMSERLGQQLLVQNVGGAGGTLGAGQVAAAEPDGYTLLVHHIGMAVSPTIYPNLDFDPVADFTPVGLASDAPLALIARRDFPADTASELVAAIREGGAEMTIAHGGLGSGAHLCAMLFQESIGVEMVEVPYQGTAPAMTDLIGGQIDVMCDQTTNSAPQIVADTVKSYAVTSQERMPNLPDLPTTAEVDLPEVQLGVWHGLYGPAGLDPAIVERLAEALQAAMEDENVLARFADISTLAASPEEATPEALTERLTTQIEFWRPIIERAGVQAQ